MLTPETTPRGLPCATLPGRDSHKPATTRFFSTTIWFPFRHLLNLRTPSLLDLRDHFCCFTLSQLADPETGDRALAIDQEQGRSARHANRSERALHHTGYANAKLVQIIPAVL